jgi:hypothetical protein
VTALRLAADLRRRVDGATERLNLPVGELLIQLADEVTAHPDASIAVMCSASL